MGDGKPGLWKLLKNAKAMQDNMEQARTKLYETHFNAESGPVKLTLTGDYKILENSVQCSDATLSQQQLIQHLTEAFNLAVDQIGNASQQQVQNITKDMGLDGVFNDDQ